MSAGTQYVSSADDIAGGATVTLLTKQVGEHLERHYPGWLWAIEPEPKGGVINVRSLRISGKWGYTLHIARIQDDPSLKCVLTAGGELLERFGFRRVRYSYAEWRRREQTHGVFLPDVIDKPGYEQRRARTEKIKAELATGAARIFTDAAIGSALKAAGRA